MITNVSCDVTITCDDKSCEEHTTLYGLSWPHNDEVSCAVSVGGKARGWKHVQPNYRGRWKSYCPSHASQA